MSVDPAIVLFDILSLLYETDWHIMWPEYLELLVVNAETMDKIIYKDQNYQICHSIAIVSNKLYELYMNIVILL